jgi:SAM-dependent methyltransferase
VRSSFVDIARCPACRAERSLDLFDIALASESVDDVWCCEVLHHNHRKNLKRTFAELRRILKPGGKIIVVNETLRSPRDPYVAGGTSLYKLATKS